MLKILALPFLIFLQQHHISMTSIEYRPDTDSLNVMVKFDYNMFLQDFRQTINDDIDVEPFRKQKPFPADLANNYINSKLVIYANGRQLTGKLLSIENADGNIKLNMLYRSRRKLKILTIRNTIMTGLYPDVENLSIVRIGNSESTVKFNQHFIEETFPVK